VIAVTKGRARQQSDQKKNWDRREEPKDRGESIKGSGGEVDVELHRVTGYHVFLPLIDLIRVG
jgi:hypothetical protein